LPTGGVCVRVGLAFGDDDDADASVVTGHDIRLPEGALQSIISRCLN
jgi:hypothetical protein